MERTDNLGGKQMNNYEKIKGMTIEEMAEFLCTGDVICEGCSFIDKPEECKKERRRFENWLKQNADKKED